MATGGGDDEGQWTLNNLDKKQRNKEKHQVDPMSDFLRSEDSDESYSGGRRNNLYSGVDAVLQSSLARLNHCVHSMQQPPVENRRQNRLQDKNDANREPRRKRGGDPMLQLQSTLRHLEGIIDTAPKKRDNVCREMAAPHLHNKLRKLAEAERLVQLLNQLMASMRTDSGDEEEEGSRPHNLEVQELFERSSRPPNHRGDRKKNLNSKLNIQNAVGRRPKDNVRPDINEFCPPLESSSEKHPFSHWEDDGPEEHPYPPPPPSRVGDEGALLLCLSQCYHTIYLQQREIHRLSTRRQEWLPPKCFPSQPIRAVIHPHTLNNQVRAPSARANNFLDNFRSYSRQNRLQENTHRSWSTPSTRHQTGVSPQVHGEEDELLVAARRLRGAEQRQKAIRMLRDIAKEEQGRPPVIPSGPSVGAESSPHSEWVHQLPTAAILPLSQGPPYYQPTWEQQGDPVRAVLLDVQSCSPVGNSSAFWSSLCAYVVSRARAHSALPLSPRAADHLRRTLVRHVLPAFGGLPYVDCESDFLKLVSDLLYDTIADYTESKDFDEKLVVPEDVFLPPQEGSDWVADLAEADQSPSHEEQEDAADAPQEEDPLPAVPKEDCVLKE